MNAYRREYAERSRTGVAHYRPHPTRAGWSYHECAGCGRRSEHPDWQVAGATTFRLCDGCHAKRGAR